MAGELSKKIGEQGEALALSFFQRIGWAPIQTAIHIDCNEPDEHSLKKSQRGRNTHGLDILFSYNCPLKPRTRRNVLVSMKNSDYEKTNNRVSLVRDDLRELDMLLACFMVSEKRAELNSEGGADFIEEAGVLIRINRDSNTDRSYLGNELASSSRPGNMHPLHFIENERFDFVDSCMNYLDIYHRDSQNAFNIHRNSLNIGSNVRQNESKILPLQSLVGGPLIVRSLGITEKSLIIFSDDPFSPLTLKRLIGLAQQCSNGWPSKVKLVLNGYDRSKEGIIEGVLAQISDKSFARTIQCDSFEIKSRLR